MSSSPKRSRYATGINDGLRWSYLCKVNGTSDPAEIVKKTWWWRGQGIRASLYNRLRALPDYGFTAFIAYEAVSRLLGSYVYDDIPFNLLSYGDLENFIKEYRVISRGRRGPAILRDPFLAKEHFERIAKMTEQQRQYYYEIEAETDKEYSQAYLLRINPAHPPSAVAKAVKNLAARIRKDLNLKKAPQNRRLQSPEKFESWDLRRWAEDEPGFENKYAKLLERRKVSHPAITKARKYATEIKTRFSALSETETAFCDFEDLTERLVENDLWGNPRKG